MDCEHVRFLAQAQLLHAGHYMNVVFTRSFIADQYKGERRRPITKDSTTTRSSYPGFQTGKLDHNFYKREFKIPISKKTGSVGVALQSPKYYTSVSHTLRTLLNKDDTSNSSSTNDEENDDSNHHELLCSKLQIQKRAANAGYDSTRFHLACPISNDDGFTDVCDDLTTQLARLGLPTAFGAAKKRRNPPPPQMETFVHTYDYSDDESSIDQRLLRISAEVRTNQTADQLNHRLSLRRRVCSESYPYKSLPSCCLAPLTRSTSTDDTGGYHRAIFSNLCYLIELAYSFQQDSVHHIQCQLSLAPAWFSSKFNLFAFLYHSKHYWRHVVPFDRRRGDERNERSTTHNYSSLPTTVMSREIESDPALAKYWSQRFRFFSRFNQGIQMDRAGFFSATPEAIAVHQAYRIHRSLVTNSVPVDQLTIVDACSGTGVNSIQLALLGFNVIGIEIDRVRLVMSEQNAKIYGVGNRIKFICADFFKWAQSELSTHDPLAGPKYAAVYMSPPWGGPTYSNDPVFDLNDIQFDHPFWSAVQLASQLSGGNLVLFLPRNTNMAQLVTLEACVRTVNKSSSFNCTLEVEVNVLNSKFKTISVYTGQLATSLWSVSRNEQSTSDIPYSSDDDDDDELDYHSDCWESDYFHSLSSSSDESPDT